MVILRTRNKITDFFMILAWAVPLKRQQHTLRYLGHHNIVSLSLMINMSEAIQDFGENVPFAKKGS